MAVNYDLCAYKLSLPEAAVNGSRCSVKLTFIGKDQEAETQLMILSCQLVSFKRGADRKWTLEDMKLTESVEIDRSLIRERRRKMRKSIL